MGPNARSVLQALKRIDNLPAINTIAVGHGPLLKEHLKPITISRSSLTLIGEAIMLEEKINRYLKQKM